MPLLWLSLCFLGGLVTGSAYPGPVWLPLAAGLALGGVFVRLGLARLRAWWAGRFPLSVLSWLVHEHPALRVAPLALGVALALGAGRFSASQGVPPDSPAMLNERGFYRMVGVVSEPPDRREQSTLVRVKLEQAAPLSTEGRLGPSQAVNGTLLVLLRGRASWQYGDRVEVIGQPETPPGRDENADFSYRDYLVRQGIYSYCIYPRVQLLERNAGGPLLSAIFALRERALQAIYQIFPSPEAPLLAGILLGMESDIPPALEQAFQDTGTAHIIAISGFNMAILAKLFSLLFASLLGRVFSRWGILALTVLALAGYTILAGAGASVIRAAIMGSLALLAAQLGRRSGGMSGFNTLSFTAAAMCLFNPLLPWDASFQLSFAATLGLMLYASPLQEGFTRLAARWLSPPLARRLSGPVGEYLLFTLAAQFTTLPVILYHFQRLSISAFLVNPLVLPAQPPVMVLSGLAVLAALVLEPVGRLLAWLALPLTTYTIRMIELFAGMAGGVVLVDRLDALGAALLFAAVTVPAFVSGLSGKLAGWVKAWVRPGLILVSAGLLAAFLLRVALSAPDGRLHVTVFEQGGQLVTLVQAPDGNRMLVNVGASANRLGDELGRRFSPVDRRIDMVLVADCASGAIEALPVLLERYAIERVWWVCEPPDTSLGHKVMEALEDREIESRLFQPGEQALLGGEVVVEVLGARDETGALRLVWKNFRTVFPGGMAPGSLGEAAVQPGLLVLGPAGFAETAPGEWATLGAQTVIAAPLDDLKMALPAEWVTLAPWGWVKVITDGASMRVEASQ